MRRLLAGWVILSGLAGIAGCVKRGLPDSNTGEDGTYDGAESLALDPATGKGDTDGTVSYPGGDRVDWVAVELPAGRDGSLELSLSWKSPRPGGDLSFKVYGGDGRELGSAGPRRENVLKRSKKTRASKSKSVGPTTGTVYIEIYASRRADAGDYELRATFTGTEVAGKVDRTKLQVPLPPRLAMVPDPCDVKRYDPDNPECDGIPKPCTENCGPKVEPTVLCPSPQVPDRNIADCKQYFKPCDENAMDFNNPWCDGIAIPPLPGDLVSVRPVDSKNSEITINLGSNEGVVKGWEGDIVDANGKPITKGRFKVASVKSGSCTAKIKMREADVNRYTAVRLYQPDPRPKATPNR